MVSVIINVFDIDGFGDMVSAVKVGKALQGAGHSVKYHFDSTIIERNLDIVFPELAINRAGKNDRETSDMVIDQIGTSRRDVTRADIGINEFDFSRTETGASVMITPGLADDSGRINEDPTLNGQIQELGGFSPRIYSPYMAGDLPQPGEENIRDIIIESFRGNHDVSVKNVLHEYGKIGVCYAAYSTTHVSFIEELCTASRYSAEKLGTVILANTKDTSDIIHTINQNGLKVTVALGSEVIQQSKGSRVLVALLGIQPQTVATRLFWASEMPNLVTGDNSLSDAVFGLVYGNGQGFFYEMCSWKHRTTEAIKAAMTNGDTNAEGYFSRAVRVLSRMPRSEVIGYPIADVISSTSRTESYTNAQRNGLTDLLRGVEVGEPRVERAVVELVESGTFRAHKIKGRSRAKASACKGC